MSSTFADVAEEKDRPLSAREVVAERLAEVRKARGLTQAQLAEAFCAQTGRPITNVSIARIENGRREAVRRSRAGSAPSGKRARNVDVDELFDFAFVLDVSPVDLLIPDRDVEVRCGNGAITTEQVVRWLTGLMQWGQHADMAHRATGMPEARARLVNYDTETALWSARLAEVNAVETFADGLVQLVADLAEEGADITPAELARLGRERARVRRAEVFDGYAAFRSEHADLDERASRRRRTNEPPKARKR